MFRFVPALSSVVLCGLLVCQSAQGAAVEVEVTIKSVDLQSRQITVAYQTKNGQKTIDLDVSRKAEITANGKTVSLDALKPGDQAKVTFEKDVQIVTKIAVGTGSQSPPTVKGNRGQTLYRHRWPDENTDVPRNQRTLFLPRSVRQGSS